MPASCCEGETGLGVSERVAILNLGFTETGSLLVSRRRLGKLGFSIYPNGFPQMNLEELGEAFLKTYAAMMEPPASRQPIFDAVNPNAFSALFVNLVDSFIASLLKAPFLDSNFTDVVVSYFSELIEECKFNARSNEIEFPEENQSVSASSEKPIAESEVSTAEFKTQQFMDLKAKKFHENPQTPPG